MGHIRDLPKSQLGVDIENDFEPKYINIRGKADLIKSLKKDAKNAKKVFLATDPDREGEAISWHLANALGIEPESKCRVTFNEITKTAVKASIKEPRSIDMDLVDAQQARRVLDRVVGYKISPILWEKVKKGLSAGRVQSVATRIITEREEEIRSFEPKEYWNVPPKGNHVPYKEVACLSGAGFGVHWTTLLASAIGLDASNFLVGASIGLQPMHLSIMLIVANLVGMPIAFFRGWFFDNHKMPGGKFIPIMLRTPIPIVAISTIFVWLPYENFSYGTKVAVVWCMYMLLQFFLFIQLLLMQLIQIQLD